MCDVLVMAESIDFVMNKEQYSPSYLKKIPHVNYIDYVLISEATLSHTLSLNFKD